MATPCVRRWPLTTWLASEWDWRTAVLVWAALHLLLGLPLNAGLRRPSPQGAPSASEQAMTSRATPSRAPVSKHLAITLALAFAISAFIGTSMAAHLPALLKAAGTDAGLAVLAAAMLGPAQVAARLMDAVLQRHGSAITVARVAVALHPLGALALMVLGPVAAIPFALLHGAGNGLMTIVMGALPLAVFGSQGYGERQGWLMAPARLAQAVAPWAFASLMAPWGLNALVVTTLGGLVMLAMFSAMPVPKTPGSESAPQPQRST
ncbi:hypothetical protein Q5W_02965 [Hydrogenophaga sp. PBC]|uniref:hypothetical protein n=1 Tax=Hydrogenophaga sp. PBC TaxID=795665 RepID=UPI0002607BEB|nr:hypothetical protein [Hydrogenophaga sp. PBC]AOS78014.1 hypothetical protein Q5W_02965 [Hydrogenophaga sp. PBC]